MGFLVVDLGLRIALRADSSDKIESREASAGTDSNIPDFVSLAGIPTDPVCGIIGEEGRTHSAGVSDEIVSLLADTVAVYELFIRIAGRSAEAKIEDVSLVADAFLSHGVEGRVKGAGSACSISEFEEFGEAFALAGLYVVDSLCIAWDPADAEALVIDFVPVALAADAINGVVSSDAAALSVGKDLIGTTSNHTESSLVPIS